MVEANFKRVGRLVKTTGVTDDRPKANVQIPMTESGKTAEDSVVNDSESVGVELN